MLFEGEMSAAGKKKASTRAGLKKHWKQCEQCRAFLSKA